MDIRKKFGKRLRQLREERGWSQEEFADRAGLHRTYVSAVERGVRNPTLSVLSRLADALAVTLSDLVETI
ncbi:helix-turn-helix transcriptional regulator [Hyphomonas sp. WL0036]|uniref:helix-turn-helix domain-containing protein n=1 Tax=Hyphomonas sediminis TaxID=2866160 RepID=UPI001C8089E3|nr:helix-turn-helix transcriptional regulator [Hyphomonas sediminis]MBY9068241.1 helix-turn-helix transcriptional regulator [Hyphomonas sediminis]